MAELRGVGIGLGVAQGPVVRMAEPAARARRRPSSYRATKRRTRVREAVAAVARELEGARR